MKRDPPELQSEKTENRGLKYINNNKRLRNTVFSYSLKKQLFYLYDIKYWKMGSF